MSSEFLNQIVQMPLSDNEYFKEAMPKRQIYLHHTAGNSSGVNVIKNWDKDSRGRIATCVCISGKGATEGDGKIVQAFSSKYWAYHLGVKRDIFETYDLPYLSLDKISIGIEICAWGQLTKSGDKFFNYVNREVAKEDVCELDEKFKGHRYFHRYTDEQIRSVEKLLIYWNEVYGISLKYDPQEMWDISLKALSGENGVYTHNSVRKDKVDVFPQPELIDMLKSL